MENFANKLKGYLMQDAVDCPEWIVPFHIFKSLAEEVRYVLLLTLGR